MPRSGYVEAAWWFGYIASSVVAFLIFFWIVAICSAAAVPLSRPASRLAGTWDVEWGVHRWQMTLHADGRCTTEEPHQTGYGTWRLLKDGSEEFGFRSPCLLIDIETKARPGQAGKTACPRWHFRNAWEIGEVGRNKVTGWDEGVSGPRQHGGLRTITSDNFTMRRAK